MIQCGTYPYQISNFERQIGHLKWQFKKLKMEIMDSHHSLERTPQLRTGGRSRSLDKNLPIRQVIISVILSIIVAPIEQKLYEKVKGFCIWIDQPHQWELSIGHSYRELNTLAIPKPHPLMWTGMDQIIHTKVSSWGVHIQWLICGAVELVSSEVIWINSNKLSAQYQHSFLREYLPPIHIAQKFSPWFKI